MPSRTQLQEIVANPSEGLNEEHKTWLDPQVATDAYKILRAIYALRNRNGGYLIIGINSVTQAVDPYPYSDPIEAKFHLDEIQSLVSRHANTPFDLEVRHIDAGAGAVVVVVVPEGVRTPVVAAKPLIDKSSGKELVAVGDLFFRTLNANGVPSSAKILPRDFDDLLEITFNNREADVGRFIRRHLPGLDLDACLTSKRKIKGGAGSSSLEMVIEDRGEGGRQPNASLRSRAYASLAQNEARFVKYLTERGQTEVLSKYANSLTLRIAVVLSPVHEDTVATNEFLNTVASSNPRYTGWPFWLDSRGFRSESMRPFVSEGAWNTLIVDTSTDYRERFEYYRLDAQGEFYARRVTQDDTGDNERSGRVFDPFLMIIRVAEALAVASSIARALGWKDDAHLGAAFDWSGLKERRLSAWANPRRILTTEGVAHDDQFGSYVDFRLDTPIDSLAPYVERVMKGLLALFEGFQLNSKIYEDLTQQLVERRL